MQFHSANFDLLGNTSAEFERRNEYNVGDGPHAVFVADLNDDGFNDTVTANYYGDNVSVLINNGDGTFAEHVMYDVDIGPRSVFLADLDDDLDMDIITGNMGDSDTVTILFNNGDGTFSGRTEYDVGDDPRAVFVADVGEDANGDLDILTANYWSDDVSVLLNNGGGIFATAVTYNVDNGAYGIYAADFDGDGKNDIATANFLDDTISVLLNNGDGTFADQVSYSGEDGPRSIYCSDVDGVNRADIIVANRLANNVSIFLNNGDGTFTSPINYEVGLNPLSVHVKDIDGDNDPDIITANNHDNSVSILKNKGDGTFKRKKDRFVGAGPYSVFIADVGEDSNNDMEIIAANNNVDTMAVLLTNHPPTIAIIEPDGIDDVANTNYSITWVDFDFDDDAFISLYYYNETSGMWELIITGIWESDPQNSYEWNITSLPEGEYQIKAVISDPYESYTNYSVGNITVSHTPPNIQPWIRFIEPDGTNDLAHYNYTIKWEDADPDDNAEISLYYDDDNTGGSGIWIVDLKEDDIDFYNWNTTLIPEGQWYILAIIEDPWHAPIYNYSHGPLTIDHPSTLPPNLKDGKVTPTSGFEGDHFNFTVNYSHVQNQMPKKVTLNLTTPYQVTYEMLESDVSDKNYVDGKIFYYNLSLSDGVYSYHFGAFDGVFWNETREVSDHPIVARLPPNLSNGKVFPYSGLEVTFFNFTVNYSDYHNDPALAITLNLTGSSSGIFPMMEVDFGDTDTIDGKEYYFNSTLLVGIYSYHFAASNGIYWVETEEVLDSPIVTEGEPALIECKVIPSSGLGGENFNYTVTYFDPNNDLPTEIWVNITGPSGGNFMMVEVNPDDTDCIGGKLYDLNLTLLKGIYSYHFAASDGTYWVETLEIINSPQVFNNIPSLSSIAVTPTTGFGGQYFNFTVIYTDADNDAPINIMVNITGPSGGNFIMMEVSQNYQNFAEGKLYYYNTVLSAGTYSYHFSATDGIHWVETSEMPASLIVANNPPWIKITYPPESGVTVDDYLTITWVDLDPEDDAMISLYYDTDLLNHDGILILSNISEDDETDSYTWSTLSIPNGTYYIYAMICDDVNFLVYNYSVGFVRVEHPVEDLSEEEMQFASSTDPSFSLIMVAIIIAIILSLILLAFKRRRTAPEEKIIETEAEEEPQEAGAEPENLLSPKIEARLEKLEKELDKLLTEEVEPVEEGKEPVNEASLPADMEEYIFICPRCVTLLKKDMNKCPGCGFSFDFEENAE